MKNLIFSSLIALSLVGFAGCTNSHDAEVGTSTKCSASGKCGTDKIKKTSTKCASSGKCG
ncbi:MAG: hypothetical protein QM493_09125 [Sulfurovum sp.]